MGELRTQVLAGGPPPASLEDHPAIVEVLNTRLTGWELYRAQQIIRAKFFKAMSCDYHLHVWTIIEALGGPNKEDMGEKEARTLAGIIAGEWGVGTKLGQAVADGIREYATKLNKRELKFKLAAKALVRLADRYAPVKKEEEPR